MLCPKTSPQLAGWGTPLGLGKSGTGPGSPTSWEMLSAADGHFSHSYLWVTCQSVGGFFRLPSPVSQRCPHYFREKVSAVPLSTGGVPSPTHIVCREVPLTPGFPWAPLASDSALRIPLPELAA